MISSRNKGFTLLELLVVIAIIGILSSVVLVAFKNGRNKATKVAVKANIVNARPQAELYYSTYGTYAGACAAVDGLSPIQAGATASGSGSVLCLDSSTAWALSARVNATSGSNWCVDSTGIITDIIGDITTTNC